MPVKDKYQEALYLALNLVAYLGAEIEVTEENVRYWPERVLYRWLETWGYEWADGEWVYTEPKIDE